MRKFLIATAMTALMCGSALAQTTNAERMNKAGMSNPMNANAEMMRHHRKHHAMKKKMMHEGMGDGMMKNDGMMNNGKKM
jgi:hypothetical protein